MLWLFSQLDGRVKTLHPNIHGGILARRDLKHHIEALNTHGIGKLCCYQLLLQAHGASFLFCLCCAHSFWEVAYAFA